MVPVVSVMPYICTKPHLKTSMHSFSSAAGIGEAPYSMYFSREKSTVFARGCRTTNCIAAGTMNSFVMPDCSKKSSTLVGSNSRAITPRAP